jgi:hypothetical protein
VLQGEKNIFTERQQKRHHKSRHISNPLMMYQMEDTGAHNNKQGKIMSQQGGVSATNPSNAQNRVTFPFSNQESQNYFEKEHLHGLCTAYLATNFPFKLDLIAPNLHNDDVLLQVKLAELISSMTVGQQIKFTEVMYQQSKVNQLHQSSHGNKSWLSCVLTRYPDLRRLFLKSIHAFLPNLPRPPVNTLKEHLNVSLIDCVAYLLGHGMDLDVITGSIAVMKDKDTPVQLVTETKETKKCGTMP